MSGNNNSNLDLQEVLRMAQSPAGQQLIQLLRAKGGQGLENAMEKAAQGSYQDAGSVLKNLMSDPQARALLEQLRR